MAATATAVALAWAAAFAAVHGVIVFSVALCGTLSAAVIFALAPYLFLVFVWKDFWNRGAVEQ